MARATGGRRTITAPLFSRLLASLHPDAEQAGQEYVRLRRTLVKFFDWRGASLPEECADEALDRLARRLADTTVGDVRHYARGIARLVLLERRRLPAFSSLDAHPDLAGTLTAPPDDEPNRLERCFDRCLAGTPDDGRALLIGYYEGERQEKIANRRRLAAALGLSENALRSRVQRLRDRLEQCVQSCVAVMR